MTGNNPLSGPENAEQAPAAHPGTTTPATRRRRNVVGRLTTEIETRGRLNPPTDPTAGNRPEPGTIGAALDPEQRQALQRIIDSETT